MYISAAHFCSYALGVVRFGPTQLATKQDVKDYFNLTFGTQVTTHWGFELYVLQSIINSVVMRIAQCDICTRGGAYCCFVHRVVALATKTSNGNLFC